MKKKMKSKGYKAGGVTQQELAEMKALAKKSGKSGPDQPLLERRKSLKGQKRNVSPEETRARKKEKEKKMKAGGKMKAKGMKAGGKVKAKGMNMGGWVSRGRGSTTTPLGNQRAQRAMGTRFEKMGGFSGAMDRARQSMFKALKGKGMKEGGKLPMVEKDGKMVPFFAADGKGKMMGGGMVPKTKGYFKGGKTMESGAIGRGDYKGSLVGEFHAGNLPRSRVGRALRISGQKNAPPTRTYSPKTKRTGTAPRSRRSPR